MTSTWTLRGGSSAEPCLIRASAVYRPAGPEPMTATVRVFMNAILHLPGGPAATYPPALPPGYASGHAELVAFRVGHGHPPVRALRGFVQVRRTALGQLRHLRVDVLLAHPQVQVHAVFHRLGLGRHLKQDPRPGQVGLRVGVANGGPVPPDQHAVVRHRVVVGRVALGDHLAYKRLVGRLDDPAERLGPPAGKHVRLAGVHGDLEVNGHGGRFLFHRYRSRSSATRCTPRREWPGATGSAPGKALPPLLLDDEAIAVVVSLRSAASHTVAGLSEASVSALAKLDQVLPARLRERTAALQHATVALAGPGPVVDPAQLSSLAAACRRRQRLRLRYRNRSGSDTSRIVEPHRLVSTGYRWYLMAFDVARADWRTFRVDRIADAAEAGGRFVPRAAPDPAAFVASAVTTRPYRHQARILVQAPARVVAEEFSRTSGIVADAGDDRCLLTTGSDTLDAPTFHLASLGADFTVLERPSSCEVRPAPARTSPRSPCARKRCGSPKVRTGVATSASRRCLATASPNPPAMPLSSTVTTSRCRAAAPASASSSGLTQRGSTTVTPMPWPVSRSATSTASAVIGPAASSSTSWLVPSAGPASTSMPPSFPMAGRSPGALPRGNLSAVGPSLTATASRSSSVSLLPSRGTATRIPGTICSSEPSHMPWWLAPSGPVTPARSSTNVTGSLCIATSSRTWSKARFRNVA